MKNGHNPVKVLFVCMGNICRSPSAEAVMNAYVMQAGLSDKIICDSAGTINFHAGEPADSRMQSHAKKRNYNLTSISRQITSADFATFDYIVAMDDDNVKNLSSFMNSGVYAKKITKMTDYCSGDHLGYVPDPYYGGAAGFEQVIDILEDACEGLLTHIKHEHQL